MRQVRAHDPGLTEERGRTIMGSLGLVGDKAVRQIGSLSGGEKARVALATFCLTPCNVLLLDEPTNHLDVDAIAALLEAIDQCVTISRMHPELPLYHLSRMHPELPL